MTERCLIIFLISFLYFLKSLGYKYVSDDVPVRNNGPKPKNKFEKRWMQLYGSIRVNEQEDHFLTIFIHSIVCVFIYLAFRATDISYLAAFLFMLNPINNQGSVWVSGRGYVLPTLFMLIALTFPIISPVCFYVTTFFNVGYLAPILFIGSSIPWVLCFMPIIWAINFKKFRGDVKQKVKAESFDADKKIGPKKLILYIKTFGFYFIHALIPVKTTFYHSYMQSLAGSGEAKGYSLKDRFFWLGIIIIISIGFYWVYVPWNTISFGLLWWTVCISPFCNLYRMSQEIAERYVYMPNVGLMVALASVLINYPIMAAVFLSMYATKMWFWMDAYQDEYYLVEQSCLNSPDAWFVWHIRALKRWDVQSYKEAIILWTMAKMISPREFKVLFNLATMLHICKHQQEARAFLDEAAKHIPAGQEESAGKLIEEWKNGKMAVLV